MRTPFSIACFIVVCWLAIAFFTSCSYTIRADGTRTFHVDAESTMRAIEVLATK